MIKYRKFCFQKECRTLQLIVILILLLTVPIAYTVGNVIFLLKKNFETADNARRGLFDVSGILIGALYFSIAIGFAEVTEKPWTEPLVAHDEYHFFFSYEQLPTIIVLILISALGYFALRFFRSKLPPLPFALCLSGVFIGVLLMAAFTVQTFKVYNDGIFFIIYFPLLYQINLLICIIRLVRACVLEKTKALAEDNSPLKKNRFIEKCGKLLTHSTGWLLAAFILMFPLLIILLAILALFGQAPDSIIRAFTDTADWTFSQKIAPEKIYGGHYLCTAAAKGDKKLVKPLRTGLRHGDRIIVNRQLCVANAFEDWIMQHTPRFHKAVRAFYDRRGYPLSKHITTPARANVTYVLMKPLEWAFVVFLYLVDKKPENRIAAQYLGDVRGLTRR
jgi:hypothetical protein